MSALGRIKDAIRPTPLAVPFILAKSLVRAPASQNDEDEILKALIATIAPPQLFVEFGFSGWEFNCAGLINSWSGLLIDGDRYNVTIARTILPRRIEAWRRWLTLANLDDIVDWVAGRDLGILSVDVDGNDFWFIERLLGQLRPAILIAEYNSTFGDRSVTVPYAEDFDRRNYPEWAYFGTSLTALTRLGSRFGYRLARITPSGVNAFFVRDELWDKPPLDPEADFREHFRPDGSGATSRFAKIAGLPLIAVDAGGDADLPPDTR